MIKITKVITMTTNNLKLLSYNLYGGVHNNKIIQGFRENKISSDIFCFQEFPEDVELQKPFLQFIGNKYKSIKSLSWKLTERTIGLATFYNSTKFFLRRKHIIHLPRVNLKLHERLFCSSLTGKTPIYFDRTAIISILDYIGVTLTVVNTHNAWEGGINHQIDQFNYIVDVLRKLRLLNNVIIFCGDLNVIGDSNNGRLLIDIAGHNGFGNFSKNIPYSCDFASRYSWPEDKARPVRTFLKFLMRLSSKLGIDSRKKIDYVFGLNLRQYSSKMINMGGSDHYPILTNFFLPNQ